MICISKDILSNDLRNRNSIYMMLTRSFITSYFIINKSNGELINRLRNGITCIKDNNALIINEPSDKEKEELRKTVIKAARKLKSQYEITEEIMDEIKVERRWREKLHKMVELAYKDNFKEEEVSEFIRTNYRMLYGRGK